MIDNRKDRISIQVGLSGYSFTIQADGCDARSSGWMSGDQLFGTYELQKRYDDVSISVFSHKFALVPSGFFVPDQAREQLAEVVSLGDEDIVETVQIPQSAAVLLYSLSSSGTLPKVITESVLRKDGSKARPYPEIYHMLEALSQIQDYNKIMASYMDGYLYLVISQGKSLLLCNSFAAMDFTTAEYFIFLSLKKLQLNPEVSSIYFRTSLTEDQEMSLYRYFKSVEKL